MTDNDLLDPGSDDPNELFSNDDTVTIDPEKDYLSELVGEGKKFKDAQALAKSIVYKESHIAQIERENAELRQAAKQGLTLEEFYNKIKGTPKDPPSTDDGHQPPEKGPELSVEQIRALLKEELNKTNQVNTAKTNVAKVAQEAEKALGPGYKQLLASRAAELGMDREAATRLAVQSPEAFLELMIPGRRQSAPQTPTTPKSQVSTEHMQNKGPVVAKTKSYYDRMKRENPEYAKTPEFKVAMHNSAIELGEEFFDT